MDTSELHFKPSALAPLLIVLGLLLLVANAVGSVVVIEQSEKRVVATIDSAGPQTFTLPKAGKYLLTRDGSRRALASGVSVIPVGTELAFQTPPKREFVLIGDTLHLVLGTFEVQRAGSFTAEISADVYPITLRRMPISMTPMTLTILGLLVGVPIASIIIGIVIAIRNTNKRNRLMMEHMI